DAAANSVPQGAPANQTVGVTAAADLNNGIGLTFRLTDDAGGRFTINRTTGVVMVANGSLINARTASSYTITAQASGPAGDTASASITLGVTSAPPGAPPDGASTPNRVGEPAAPGTPVGIAAVATDLNPVTYTLTDDAGGRFAIDTNTGVVTVANGSLI